MAQNSKPRSDRSSYGTFSYRTRRKQRRMASRLIGSLMGMAKAEKIGH